MANEIQRVAVIGAGQMGRGIAQVCASAGLEVMLADATLALAEQAKQRLLSDVEKAVSKGRAASNAVIVCSQRVTVLEVAAAATVAQVVIEAISERVDEKLALFAELDRHAPKDAILASNTSSVSISQLASRTRRAEQVVGMHFMNPVPLMQLVEIVRGLQTSEATVQVIGELSTRLGKTTVLSQDRPGFIVNRVLIPMLNEACFALQEGVASIADIDRAITLGLNHPMGPLSLADLIGLDTLLAITDVLHRDFGDSKYRAATLLRNMVAAGYLGRKAQRGFYVYGSGAPVPATLPGVTLTALGS
jgi:3-hydroxybutyryl-CoA dehydrogenase